MPLLTSLCEQISLNYDQSNEEIPDEISRLMQHFRKMLACASEEKPLVIFLDSLDQLAATDGAHQLGWLPMSLPAYCKMVVTTLPISHGILDKLKDKVVSQNLVEITPLGEDLGGVVLKTWLQTAGRTLSAPQWKVAHDALSKCSLPLYIKLVYDEVARWRSYSHPRTTTLAFNIPNSIIKLLDRVEAQHGKILVSHALGYLTAAKSGLSDSEIEDLLSLDEKVLNDV